MLGGVDILSIAVGAVLVASLGLGVFLLTDRDMRDVFAESFGDVSEVPAEAKWADRRNSQSRAGMAAGSTDQPCEHSSGPSQSTARGGK